MARSNPSGRCICGMFFFLGRRPSTICPKFAQRPEVKQTTQYRPLTHINSSPLWFTFCRSINVFDNLSFIFFRIPCLGGSRTYAFRPSPLTTMTTRVPMSNIVPYGGLVEWSVEHCAAGLVESSSNLSFICICEMFRPIVYFLRVVGRHMVMYPSCNRSRGLYNKQPKNTH